MSAKYQEVTMQEWQFDGLVGPTHNYAGLSFGNVASELNKNSVSNPRKAALEGIAKMRFVASLGVPQAFFLPHYRPLISELKRLGFGGSVAKMLENAASVAPEILASLYSASAMWAANAATVTPSCDTDDRKVHFTPANLIAKYHRSVEAPFTTRQLRRIFNDERHFTVHEPLPSALRFSDEGAANHLRLEIQHSEPSIHMFVFGANDRETPPSEGVEGVATTRYPARQQEAASRAVARMHLLPDGRCIFVQQHPAAIDAGVFHHDVIGMSCGNFIAHHEMAFAPNVAEKLREVLKSNGAVFRQIRSEELTLSDAVSTYFFNSQLVQTARGIEIIAPSECAEHVKAHKLFGEFVENESPVHAVHYLDVRESMRNGGGPACLRLRVPLTQQEVSSMHQGVILTDAKATQLESWVARYYRDRLSFDDLRDPLFVNEVEEALDALTQIVGMDRLYPFQ
jgi:succinylarginine dihydrolase